MINELEKLNAGLKSEADMVLYEYGLLGILKKFGKPIIHGSYSLNLMTWRDLDIYLENDGMDIEQFFNLGMRIAEKLKPRRMSFRNEFIGKTTDLPRGLYWGIYALLSFSDEWKIDIWALDSDQIKTHTKKFEALKTKIDERNRQSILIVKNHFCKHPKYRKDFFSSDIYESVIEDDVKTIEEFSEWLKQKRGVELGET